MADTRSAPETELDLYFSHLIDAFATLKEPKHVETRSRLAHRALSRLEEKSEWAFRSLRAAQSTLNSSFNYPELDVPTMILLKKLALQKLGEYAIIQTAKGRTLE